MKQEHTKTAVIHTHQEITVDGKHRIHVIYSPSGNGGDGFHLVIINEDEKKMYIQTIYHLAKIISESTEDYWKYQEITK